MGGMPKNWSMGEPNIKPSSIRRWLGDEPCDSIQLHYDATIADIEKAKELFPESDITQYFDKPDDHLVEFKFEPMPVPTDPRSPFEVANPNALPPKLP